MALVNQKICESLNGSIEIELAGHPFGLKSLASSGVLDDDEDSNNVSLVLGPDEQASETDYMKAAIFMVGATLSWTLMHICMKLIYVRSPQITGQDTSSFIGYFIVPFMFIIGKYNKANLNIFSYDSKLQLLMLGRCINGILLNITFSNSLMYIPVSKGILIFCLNPLFCAIIAAVFLSEKITIVSISSTIGAFVGIYLLTINKGQDVQNDGHELFGYILIL